MRIDATAILLSLALPGAFAQQAGSDIWGPENEISNMRGAPFSPPAPPLSPFPSPERRDRVLNEPPRQSILELPPKESPSTIPKTLAWKDLCTQHFQTMSSRDADEQARLYVEHRSKAARDERWRKYVQQRDARSAGCAANWPYDFAMKAGGETYSSVEVPLPIPAPCRRFFNAFSAIIGGRAIASPTPEQVRNILAPDGTIRTGPRDAIKMVLEDNTTLNIGPNSSVAVDWNAVCRDRRSPEYVRYLESLSSERRARENSRRAAEQVETYFRQKGVRIESQGGIRG